jgi:ABC-type transport system involved in multi-copper enzyme maturation permease subunit
MPWSNSRQSWQERIGLGVLLLAAVALGWFGRRLPLASQVVLWGGLIVALAALARRGWWRLFGPVLFYDLVRLGRRSRYILLRCLYISFLLLLLFWVYSMWQLEARYRYGSRMPRATEMAQFAESFFFTLMTVQLAVVLILTPAYLAGAIAEEKDRKTLEFMLATDLRNREIVLSKLTARLLNLAMIVLAALPVLSATQFFGGVDPDLLLASFAVLGLTMLSLSSVSILMSVYCKRPRDAIVLTYLLVLLYPALALSAWGIVSSYKIANVPLVPVVTSDQMDALTDGDRIYVKDVPVPTLGDATGAVNSGNLVYVLIQVGQALDRNKPLSDVLPDLLRNFAIFHGLLALIAAGWAVARLRAVALKETYGKAKKAPLAVRVVGRPPIGDQPMLWKEIFAEPRLQFGWLGRIAVLVLIGLSFLPLPFIWLENRSWRRLDVEMNVWVRIAGTGVSCLMLLAVAVRAAGTVHGERDRQTLDALLTTPLRNGQILLAKWLGAILSVRLAWIWLGAMWTIAVFTGGLLIPAVPFMLVAWAIYAGGIAAVGLWFSVVCRTTLRATVWTLLTTLFIGGGHWLVGGMCCFMPLGILGMRGRDLEYLMKFEAGQTPPFVLGLLAFCKRDLNGGYSSKEFTELFGFSMFGLMCWVGAGLGLLALVHHRFAKMTGREVQLEADRPAPPSTPGTRSQGPAALEQAIRANETQVKSGSVEEPIPLEAVEEPVEKPILLEAIEEAEPPTGS